MLNSDLLLAAVIAIIIEFTITIAIAIAIPIGKWRSTHPKSDLLLAMAIALFSSDFTVFGSWANK